MADDKGKSQQEAEKAKVVLVEIQNEKDKYEVIKVLASQLGITFEEAGDIIEETPVELIPSIPLEAGEQFAETLREAGANIEVLPIGRGAGRFCSTHPHRRARAKCKEPGCHKYICEICIVGSKGKLLCPECYVRYKRRRVMIALASVAGVFIALWLWLAVGSQAKRWFNNLYINTKKVAVVLTAREMTEDLAEYFTRMGTTTRPGELTEGAEHTIPDIDGWFQREFERVASGQIDIVEIDTYGLYEIGGAVPKPSRDASVSWQGLKANRAFHRFFKNIEEVNGLDLNAYDHILFVELSKDSGVENDYIEKLGYYHDEVGYMRLPLKGQYSNDYYIEAVAHYVTRMLGAEPQLDEHGYPLFPSGYANPDKQPRHPQEAAEIMGIYVPTREFEIQRINNLENVVIGPHTAFQLGWISASTRDATFAAVSP
ncbi:MAG: B-box zinc finger protein [Candidatus Lernaella stagnicola]|nr:B-box zinc finger protein [Candidatus Lernaella stagnicola]